MLIYIILIIKVGILVKRKHIYLLLVIITFIAVALLQFAYPALSSSESFKSDPIKISIENIVHEQIKNNKDSNFNGAILIAKDGREIYSYAAGYANYEKKEMIKVDTPFQLASVSKQFTAMGIMILHEQGKIDIDDNITKYLPELKYENITIRHLLTHTSGMPEYIGAAGAIAEPGTPVTNDDLIKAAETKDIKLIFQPGERYMYSNTGYILLGSIIERVTKQSLGEFLNANIFTPLDMKDSFVINAAGDDPTNKRAYGYGKDGKFFLIDLRTLGGSVVGPVNQFSSVNDLLKWDAALRSNKIVKKSTMNMIFTPSKLNNGKSTNYGFGWFIKNAYDKKIAFHDGNKDGFINLIARNLTNGYTVIYLHNIEPNDTVYKVEREISNIVMSAE